MEEYISTHGDGDIMEGVVGVGVCEVIDTIKGNGW
jgi:hypothetical protein